MPSDGFLGKAAVIFDFDGTLVDSYRCRSFAHAAVCELLLAYLEKKGFKSKRAKMLNAISGIEKEMALKKEYDRRIWFSEAVNRYTEGKQKVPSGILEEAALAYWNAVIAKSFLYPHVEEVLASLKRNGMPIGMISDTDGMKGMKSRRIDASGLRPFFDAVVVAGEDTQEVKPQKQPFIRAAGLLSMPSEDCVYVGDNPDVDVAGARELGMKTVIIRNPRIRFKSASPHPDCVLRRGKFDTIQNSIYLLLKNKICRVR